MNFRYAPRLPILEELAHQPYAVVEASAGTGKTYTLENLVVDLIIREGIPLEKLLIVTFTEKATAELKLRLRKKLQSLLDLYLRPVEEFPPPNSPHWVLDAEAQQRLTQAVLSFDRASIATIHGFCQRILLEHAFAHRRPFRQSLIDAQTAFNRAFISSLRTDLARDSEPLPWLEAWLEHAGLDDLQRTAFACTERRGQLTPQFNPAQLRKTMHELGKVQTHPRAVRPLLTRAKLRRPVIAQTLHQLHLLLDILSLGPDNLPLVLQKMEKEGSEHLRHLIATLTSAHAAQPALTHLFEALVDLEAAIAPFRSAALQVLLPRIQSRLRNEKNERGELDFADMLQLLNESLHSEDGERLKNQLLTRYPAAIIDEFQDTDETQWNIFKRLYLERSDQRCRLVVIGDPKQAIYGFRGADVGTYLRAREELESKGGCRVALSKSYRSTPRLVDAINELLSHDASPPFFPGVINYTEPVSSGRTDSAHLQEHGQEGPPAVLLSLNLEDPSLSNLSQIEAILAEVIAQEISRLLGLLNDPPIQRISPEGNTSPLSPSDIFILTRSSREGRTITEALNRVGVRAAVYKQEGLFQSQEAYHLYALLAAIDQPHATALAIRAFGTPFFAIPMSYWSRYVDIGPGDPLISLLLSWKAVAEKRDYPRLFSLITRETKIYERLLLEDHSERAITNYTHLFEALGSEAAQGRPPLYELVQRFKTWLEGEGVPKGSSNIERQASDADTVQVMTMHKAKGLEAEVVFLFGGNRSVPSKLHTFHENHQRCLYLGDTPPKTAVDEAEDEIRRLLYVALTRARTRIYVPYLTPCNIPKLGGTQALLEPHLTRVASAQKNWVIWDRSPLPASSSSDTSPPLSPSGLAVIEDALAEEVTRDHLGPLRQSHMGPLITSYSRIKAEQAFARPQSEAADDKTGERASSSQPIDPNVLPPGAASGLFLHEVIEEVDLEQIRDIEDFEAWYQQDNVQLILTTVLERHQRRPEHARHGAQLIWSALKTPLNLEPFGQLEGGLCSAPKVVREMEFLFPFPAAPENGHIKGFIDIVFEHEGRTYVLDWKSDDLGTYEPESLDEYVRSHYLLQAEIYTIAVVRLLGIASNEEYEARFGTSLYAFFRGLGHNFGAAQWSYRPTWQQIIEASAKISTPYIST